MTGVEPRFFTGRSFAFLRERHTLQSVWYVSIKTDSVSVWVLSTSSRSLVANPSISSSLQED
jgi:hypothetical protein